MTHSLVTLSQEKQLECLNFCENNPKGETLKYPEPESAFLEFKREMPKNDQVIKTIIGFCNRYGGEIVIGVDNDRTIIGISDDEVESMMESLDRTIYEATAPPILPLVYTR